MKKNSFLLVATILLTNCSFLSGMMQKNEQETGVIEFNHTIGDYCCEGKYIGGAYKKIKSQLDKIKGVSFFGTSAEKYYGEYYDDISEQTWDLLKGANHLTVLLFRHVMVPREILVDLIKNKKNLQMFVLENWDRSARGVKYQCNKPVFENWGLRNYNDEKTNAWLGDDFWKSLGLCKELRRLKLATKSPRLNQLSDARWLDLASQLSKLEELELHDCIALTDKGFSAIGMLKNLRILSIEDGNLSDKTLERLLGALANLKELRLLKCKEITSDGVASIAKGKGALEVLELKGRTIYGLSFEITEEALTCLVEKLKKTLKSLKLQYLVLNNTTPLSKLERLQKLIFHGCLEKREIDDTCINTFAQLSNLQALCIFGQCLSTDQVKQLLRSLKKLTCLELQRFNISQDTYNFLAGYAKQNPDKKIYVYDSRASKTPEQSL